MNESRLRYFPKTIDLTVLTRGKGPLPLSFPSAKYILINQRYTEKGKTSFAVNYDYPLLKRVQVFPLVLKFELVFRLSSKRLREEIL